MVSYHGLYSKRNGGFSQISVCRRLFLHQTHYITKHIAIINDTMRLKSGV